MTEEKMIEKFEKQHLETYKKAVLEIIRNNTHSLVEEDIFSLIKKPPLDSMDLIKSKLLELAKKQNIVLDTSGLNRLLENFRNSLKKRLECLNEIREKMFFSKIEKFKPKREMETIIITTKDFTIVNKDLKKQVKIQIKNTIEELVSYFSNIYTLNTPVNKKEKVQEQFLKYMKGPYQKQLLENITMKMLIKDRTLSNGISEQGERYMFTKMNSHIFDDLKKGATE